MNKKKKLILVEKATADGGRKNELYINNGDIKCSEWKVEMYGIGGKKVEHFHDLSEDYEVNSAVITLKFDRDDKLSESEEGQIQYLFSNPNPKSKEERKTLETEALTDYLINKKSAVASLNFEQEISDMKVRMDPSGRKINLVVEEKKNPGSIAREIRGKGIKIKGKFFIKQVLSLEDVIIIEPEKNKPYWTRNKIILLSIAATIILLIFFFRKKIWKWIKGETKQEKKAESQLDIF